MQKKSNSITKSLFKKNTLIFIILGAIVLYLINKYYTSINAPTDDPSLLFVFLIFATFVSEDLTCITAGIFASKGYIPFSLASLGCFIGICIGDITLYTLGRYIARSELKSPSLGRLISPTKIDKASKWIQKRSAVVILSSRFLPGTRLATYIAAGLLKVPFKDFLIYFLLAAALWTPFFVGISLAWGSVFLELMERYKFYALPTLILTLATFWFIYKFSLSLCSWKGRRLILSKYHKLTMWEFWPRTIFYTPVFLYILYLGFIRYRKPILFSITNPSMPYSGFWNESKYDILSQLDAKHADKVSPFTLIKNDLLLSEKLEILTTFQQKHHITYPIVLKPNMGERGENVEIIKNKDQAIKYFENSFNDIILQKFIPGPEYGIFYYRLPNETNGHILSITQKRLFTIKGNGKDTLESLLYSNKRSLAKIKNLLVKFENQLENIPANGEIITLSDIGAHRFGTFCIDDTDIATSDLLHTLDSISHDYKGFYFGRFDVKTHSTEFLQKGIFTIIELNGITSEAIHVYDSVKSSPLRVYKTLLKQWQIAFKIAHLNFKNGYKPKSTNQFLSYFFNIIKNHQD